MEVLYQLSYVGDHTFSNYGAGNRSRTRDLLITNQLLYQLSYASTIFLKKHGAGDGGRTHNLQLGRLSL
jgi:hypothetical protein